ncbi:acyltransferase [Candidatus Thorarchaeota archaeon]|nr:MAG: acyltransferase [Candidatus Thorarchaeota archaeon]
MSDGVFVPHRRFDWIDIAKGVGILSVMLVHSVIPAINAITVHLSSFTIPLFFVLTGLTYSNEKHRHDFRALLRTRGQQFMVPYFILYVIMMLLFAVLAPYVDTYLTPNQLLFWFVYGSGPPDSVTHLWFLPVLFFGFSVFVILDHVLKDQPHWARYPLFAFLPLLAIWIQALFSPALVPWHLNAILISATFVLIGNEIRWIRGLKSWRTKRPSVDLVLAMLLGACLIVVSQLNGFTDLAVDKLGASVWLYLVTGTLGSIIVFIVSSYLTDLPERARSGALILGRNSQEIYEFHPLTFFIPAGIFVLLGLPLEPSLLLWLARFTVAVFVSIPSVLLVVNRFSVTQFIFKGYITDTSGQQTEESASESSSASATEP